MIEETRQKANALIKELEKINRELLLIDQIKVQHDNGVKGLIVCFQKTISVEDNLFDTFLILIENRLRVKAKKLKKEFEEL